jgi:CheY-like chemotaxis protein
MPVGGPIIIIEDDEEDQQIVEHVMQSLHIKNPINFFDKCEDVIPYLLSTADKPFLILSDVNLPGMSGPELKKEINKNELLRKKSIPFVFFSTAANKQEIDRAYEMMVQGYFKKENSMDAIISTLKIIMDYWTLCKHPNNT